MEDRGREKEKRANRPMTNRRTPPSTATRLIPTPTNPDGIDGVDDEEGGRASCEEEEPVVIEVAAVCKGDGIQGRPAEAARAVRSTAYRRGCQPSGS